MSDDPIESGSALEPTGAPDAIVPELVGAGDGLAAAEEPAQYLVDLSIVFNDPNLYGLRISLDGPAAKIFAGLEFEIMYKKVTDTVGVYQAQLKLPDVMRTFSIGAYSITLPVFAIAVYTNGDFKVDIGFPWNNDFSRSFNIQGIVPPGIPVTGSGGFYFGKLSSATSDQVPKITSGTFNPVIIFGFGLQVGVGKSIEMGILQAGFSITVFGIIQGVVATYNPYVLGETGDAPKSQMQGAYYFWLQGSVGVIGKLYGTIDFAIIKASVNIELQVYVQITFESYADIPISVVASVDVSLSVKIIFFTIHLSFKAEVKATFTIKNPMGDPPWTLASGSETTSLRARHQRSLKAASAQPARLAATGDLELHWTNLAPAAVAQDLTAHLVPVLAAVGDGAALADQQVAYSLVLLIESMDQQADDDPVGTTSFELLALQIARWLVAAALPDQTITAAAVDAVLVTDREIGPDCPATPGAVDLAALADRLLSTDDRPMPLPPEQIDAFLAAQFSLLLDVVTEDSQGQDTPTTVLAMVPGLELTVPPYPPESGTEISYTFAGLSSLSDAYLAQLRAYFDQLAVQVQQEQGPGARGERQRFGADDGPSMATFLFGDEMLLIARQMIRGAQDALRNLQIPVPTASPAATVETINENAQLAPDGTGCLAPYTVAELFDANKDHPLVAGRELKVSGVTYRPNASDTFASVAARYGGAFTPQQLGEANATTLGILNPGGALKLTDGSTAPISGGDTLEALAVRYFAGSVANLVGTNVDQPDVLQALSVLDVPALPVTTADGDTLALVAQRLAVPVSVLADGDDTGSPARTDGLFATTEHDPLLSVPHLAQYPLGLLLDSFMITQGLKHLSGMCGRYLLHGMRPTTAGITWHGTPPPGADQPTCGLYSLTGQQIAIPPSSGTVPFTFSITNPGTSWVRFAGGADALDVTVTPGSKAATAIDAVRSYVTSHVLAPVTSQLGPLPLFGRVPAQFGMASTTGWEAAGSIPLPFGQAPADTPPALALWAFPDELVNLPDPDLGPITMALQVGTYDEATGRMDNVPAPWWGWGTRVAVTIKRIAPIGDSATAGVTYELVGTNEYDIVLLERLLDATQTTDAIIDQLVLLSRPGSSGSGTGLQSADPAAVQFGIAQSNLSTFTHPPTSGLRAAALDDAPPPRHRTTGCLNDAYDFIRLLWECSITRSGGFSLYYEDTVAGTGFADSVFNDKGEAVIELVVGYQPLVTGDRTIAGYMNTAITGSYVDASRSTVFAMADPTAVTLTPDPGATLRGLAGYHHMDPLQLADDNAGVALAATVAVAVTRGTYLVGSTGPGQLADIVAHVGFGVTADQIKAANPLITDWGNPLPADTVVLLPLVTVNQRTAPNGSPLATLADIAAYYGAADSDLAADNQDRPGLFAAAIAVAGGPSTRSANVPPGTVNVGASREVPPDVPDPTDPTFAETYLLHAYNLLGFRIAQNLWWPDPSNEGLPIGPTDPGDTTTTNTTAGTDDAPATSRFAVPAPKAPGDQWTYQQSVKIVRGDQTGPYVGVGDVMQLDFGWIDIFGNTILTDLDAPGSGPGANMGPIPIGYYDDLVALSMWPSIAASYRVYDDGTTPTFRMELVFSTSAYDPSDPDDLTASLAGADPLGEMPGWQRNAQQDLVVYTHLLYQLQDGGADPVVALATTTSLAGSAPVDDTARADLVGWLQDIAAFLQTRADGGTGPFTSSHGCVPLVVTPTFTVEPQPPAEPTLFCLSSPIDPGSVSTEQVFELTTTFDMRRAQDHIDADFRDTESVFAVSTLVHPQLTKQDSDGRPVPDDVAGSYTLNVFAQLLETALAEPGHLLKVATGADRSRVTEATSDQPIWIVRVGREAGQAIGYEIIEVDKVTDVGTPILYAPRPVSNELISQGGIPIYGYTTGTGIAADPTQTLSFAAVDIDVWMQAYLAAIDDFLAPELLTAAQIIGAGTTDYIGRLLAAKETIAGSLKQLLMAVLSQDHTQTDLEAAQDAFEQEMLVKLANAYTTDAVIQFHAEVVADLGPSAYSPQLYGLPGPPVGTEEDATADVSLSAAKIALAQPADPDQPNTLTFLMATRPGHEEDLDSHLLSYVELDLDYAGIAIEHQIDTLPGIEGYKASSWLSFVQPLPQTAGSPLAASLGTFKVPLVLRAFPTPPALPAQGFEAVAHPSPEPPPPPLAELLEWVFTFDYSEDLHHAQDRTYLKIRFNTSEGARSFMDMRSVFAALAQFVTVFPAVDVDLIGLVAKVTAATTGKPLTDATVALESFVQLVETVSAVLVDGPPVVPPAPTLQAQSDYEVFVQESAVTIDYHGQPRQALQVALTEVGPRPDGVGAPTIEIAGYTATPVPPPAGALAAWTYANDDGPLEPAVGAAIPRRTVEIPGLNVLDKQDALASAYLIRNQELVPGVETAEPFWYTTGEIAFADPLHPTLDWSIDIDIASLGSEVPVTRSLVDQLQTMFVQLLADAPPSGQQLQLECRYEYRVQPELDPISLPVLFLPPMTFVLDTDGKVPEGGCPGDGQGNAVCQLADGITRWFTANPPSPADGRLRFDLVVFSHTSPPAPLLRLRDLTLDLGTIDPPLPTNA